MGTKEINKITTAEEYDKWLGELLISNVVLWQKVPEKNRKHLCSKLAFQTKFTEQSIRNYVAGFGNNPRTALVIRAELEKELE